MKICYTPLNELEVILDSEEGRQALDELAVFHERLEREFSKLTRLPVTVTEEAKLKYLDLDGIEYDLKRLLLSSGLLPCFEWKEWIEGIEMIEGYRQVLQVSKIKSLKLLYVIMQLDGEQNGKFKRSLMNGMVYRLIGKVLDGGLV